LASRSKRRSDRIVGTQARTMPISAPASKGADLKRLEADLRDVVTTAPRSGARAF